MRILFLDQFDTLGGGQQCLADLVSGLTERGWVAHVGLPGRGPLAERLESAGATVHLIPLTEYTNGRKSLRDVVRFAMDMPRVASAIRRLVKAHSIDLVYVNAPRLLPAAALASNRVVFHSHNMLGQWYAAWPAVMALRWRRIPVIASSSFLARPYVERLARGQVRVVYNGVPDCGGGVWRRADARPCVGIIGRVAPEKGHLDFLRMARAMVAAESGCHFLICGDGQHSGDGFLKEVRRMAVGLPVEFVGWEPNIREVLGRVDLLVVPSSAVDATPRVIPEALSAGVPVVAYRSGGMPELLSAGGCGVLVAAGDVDALAEAVMGVLGDAERLGRMRVNTRQVYEKRFTPERYVREICGELERMTGPAMARLSSRRRMRKAAESASNPAATSTGR